MKKFSLSLILVLATSSLAIAGNPKNSKKICDSLQEKVDMECAHYMCDDSIEEGNFADLDECMSADDYAEAAQEICEELPTIEDLVKSYNKKHPTAKIKCDL